MDRRELRLFALFYSIQSYSSPQDMTYLPLILCFPCFFTPLTIISSALGGKVVNSVTTTTFALICQDSVRRNVKIEAALRDKVPLVQRAWIDWLIVHVCILFSIIITNIL